MNRTELDVEGMSCRSCVHHVDEALRALNGVAEVEVRLSEGKVIVRHDSGSVGIADLISALQRAGYPSRAGS